MGLLRADYNTEKVDNLLQVIKSAWDNGHKQEYDISVDGLKIVQRTADPQPFTQHVNHIHENSKCLVITLYKGGSQNNEKFFFNLAGSKNEPALAGLSPNVTLAEHDEQKREEFFREVRFKELEKENTVLKKDVVEKQQTIDQLSTRLQELYDGKLITIGEMGSQVFMKILQNPTIRKTFPVLEGLVPVPQENIPPEQEASFTRKGETKEDTSGNEELTEDEERYLVLIHDLQARLSPFHLSSVMHILDILTRCPQAIGTTLKHLSNYVDTIKDDNDEKI